jgi:hypothetical protein
MPAGLRVETNKSGRRLPCAIANASSVCVSKAITYGKRCTVLHVKIKHHMASRALVRYGDCRWLGAR